MSMANSSGICNNCGRKREELFPVFVEDHTKPGKCEYWCKECLMNRKQPNAQSQVTWTKAQGLVIAIALALPESTCVDQSSQDYIMGSC